MKQPTRRRSSLAVLAVAALSAVPALALAEQVIAVTTDGHLITFDSATPGTIATDIAITGVAGSVVAIDVRPEDGTLFAVSDGGVLYRLDAATGAATQVGPGAFAAAIGLPLGIDFNPVTDRLRVVNASDRNMRVNPADGSLVDGDAMTAGVQEDTALAFALLDLNFGVDPAVVGLAYTDNTPSAATSAALAIDAGLDVLVGISPADGGVLSTVGALGVDASNDVGFDISGTSATAFAAIRVEGLVTSNFYTVDTTTGAVSLVGTIGGTVGVRAITIGPANAPPAVPNREMIGLTTGNELVRFNSSTPATISSRVALTGVVLGDSLVGIDVRPATGILYGVGLQGRLYVINATTGLASPVGTGTFELPPAGSAFGVDFNPSVDRLRLVSDANQNLRADPVSGAMVDGDLATLGTQPDTNLAYDPADVNAAIDPFVVAAAYDRNVAVSGATLFGIDSSLDVLVRQGDAAGNPGSPNAGVLHTIGNLGIDTTDLVGFEIAGDASAIASLTDPGGSSRLFTVNLDTGSATLLGTVGTAETLRGLSIAPTANPAAPIPLVVTRMTIRIDFCPPGGRDTVTISGRVRRPPAPAGKSVVVDVGGFTETFVLAANGRATNTEGTRPANDNDQFSYGQRRGSVHDFSVVLRREDVSDELADEGLLAAVVRNQRKSVRVTITVDGVSYTTLVNVKYTNRNAHDGVAVRTR